MIPYRLLRASAIHGTYRNNADTVTMHKAIDVGVYVQKSRAPYAAQNRKDRCRVAQKSEQASRALSRHIDLHRVSGVVIEMPSNEMKT